MNYQILFKIIIRSFILCFWIFTIIVCLRFTGYFKEKFSEKSLNILVWPQMLDAEFLKDFEKKTGVKVQISYFDHNDELLIKLESARDHGYDLIMPSHYTLTTLIEKKLIKPIDQSRLLFWNNIYPSLLNVYSDPHNQHSIPFYWGILGIGVNKDFFKNETIKQSWDLIFKKEDVKNCVSVIDDIRELSLIAAQYLFGRIHNLNDNEVEQIINLLNQQKSLVGLYTDGRAEYAIATKTCAVGVVFLNDLMKVMKKFKSIDFIIPEEGTFIVVDSFVITSQTTKDDLIYEFLNYLYDEKVLTLYAEKFQFLSALKNIPILLPFQNRFTPDKNLFKKLQFFENVFSEETIHKMWTAIRAQ